MVKLTARNARAHNLLRRKQLGESCSKKILQLSSGCAPNNKTLKTGGRKYFLLQELQKRLLRSWQMLAHLHSGTDCR